VPLVNCTLCRAFVSSSLSRARQRPSMFSMFTYFRLLSALNTRNAP
jgi:hypothetical protein